MDSMTMSNVKGVACSDKPTENHHRLCSFSSALHSILVSFGSLFWFFFSAIINLSRRKLIPTLKQSIQLLFIIWIQYMNNS